MRTILQYLLVILLFCSCAKEESVIFDLRASVDDISRIELRADHKTLLPNGMAKMEFYTFVYGTKEVVSYNKTEEDVYFTDTVKIEYLIPNDQLPSDYIKVYDPSGKELTDNVYSTTTEKAGTVLEFYAKGGAIESNRLPITVRPLPDESYEELVVPVVFHLLIPPATSGPSYDITSEYLEQTLQRMNDIFNRRMTADPNGGNVKVTFKLAEYDKAGIRLQEKGKNVVKLSASNIKQIDSWAEDNDDDLTIAYDKFIIKNWRSCLWNPEQYLNIWLTKYVSRGSETSDYYSYRAEFPTVMHSAYDLKSIPGLKVVTKDVFTLNDVESSFEIGVMVNYMAFLNPQTQGSNEFSLATALGKYYGLFLTQCDKYKNLNSDGDNDYCADTYNFDYGYYPSVFKANNLDGQPENDPTRPKEWFTSFGVMDRYSRKSSVSADQASRMRKVMLQCPSRWCYKSQFAFTGKK
ncbi:MAG: hypothetical protein RR397_10210 [Odoribacter sp.]